MEPSKQPREITRILLLLLTILEGAAALFHLLSIPSEQQNAFLMGISKSRFALSAGCFVVLLLLIGLLFRPNPVSLSKHSVQFLLLICWIIFWGGIGMFWLSISPIQAEISWFQAIFSRGWGVFLWGILFAIQMGWYAVLCLQQRQNLFSSIFQTLLFVSFSLIASIFLSYYDRMDWRRHLPWMILILLMPSILVCLIQLLRHVFPAKKEDTQLFLFLRSALIFTLSFALIRLVSFAVARVNTPPQSYWQFFADAILHGRLHLENPLTTHDLTLYDGKWFIPNPPMPGILLIPLVAIWGVNGVNMTVFSAGIASLNVMLLYLILHQATRRGMLTLSPRAQYWVTAVFAVGTNHLWLATIGQMWFISQLVTVLFIAMAAYLALLQKPAWAQGLCLGLAILSRPNVFPMALFFLGLYLYAQADFPTIHWKKTIIWAIEFAIPAGLSIFFLLLYNRVRFGDWMDFGYVTINGADWILESVRSYGMFHPHFLRENFDVMFLRLPRFDFSGTRFFFRPRIAGFSLFVMTPPIFYCFRRFQKNWWVLGAWTSVLLTLTLLLFYHNTGAEQVGYRYLMDAIIPVMLLIGLGVGKKASALFKLLLFISAAINFLSIHWWYFGRG